MEGEEIDAIFLNSSIIDPTTLVPSPVIGPYSKE